MFARVLNLISLSFVPKIITLKSWDWELWVIVNYLNEQLPNLSQHSETNALAGIYLFKGNNGNTRTICEIYSKLTIKTPERQPVPEPLFNYNIKRGSGTGRCSIVFIVNFEQISHIVLVLFIVDFEQINPGWGIVDLSKSLPIALTLSIGLHIVLLLYYWPWICFVSCLVYFEAIHFIR